jgi:hypothetical protein
MEPVRVSQKDLGEGSALIFAERQPGSHSSGLLPTFAHRCEIRSA